jgi:D-arabinan exo alpha-(1,3)/(1,5)-arabinofuranosidase (non-reducing end)
MIARTWHGRLPATKADATIPRSTYSSASRGHSLRGRPGPISRSEHSVIRAALVMVLCLPALASAQELFEFQKQSSHWISPESRDQPQAPGAENRGAKGHPYDSIPAGRSLVLGDIDGSGMIRRIWITVSERSPAMLRSLRLDMYWDGASKPAVSAPLGDFFGAPLGVLVPFENDLFSSPEGRSFNSVLPMPFRTHARIVLTNESNTDLTHVFYDIDYTLGPASPQMLYFHAFWRRERPTTLGKDFRLLPRVNGRGRYLGATVGVLTDPIYGASWWGEGEVRIFLNGDRTHPTLVGTGTEDYIGTGWGEGRFAHRYQGSLIADEANHVWGFYRLHVPDAVFFDTGCEVTLQQIGGAMKADVLKLVKANAPLRPITVDNGGRTRFTKLLEKSPTPSLDDPGIPEAWVNFYRRDDVSATVYFYLDRPTSDLPPLAVVADRVAALPAAAQQK